MFVFEKIFCFQPNDMLIYQVAGIFCLLRGTIVMRQEMRQRSLSLLSSLKFGLYLSLHQTLNMKKLLIIAFIFILMSCAKNQNPHVLISTQLGDIEAEIYLDKAPITAANFLRYVDSARYNNGLACFYRIVRQDNQPGKPFKIEVIQGGYGKDSLIEIYQFPPIRHETTKETGVLHKDGVFSMARSEPGTASSEFFICIGDQPELDYGGKRNPDGQGFATFGKVYKGMEVVRKIQQLKDSIQFLKNPVMINSITRIRN